MKKCLSIVGGVAAGVFLLPIFVSALTVEELSAQIQALLTQIAALQQQTGGVPAVNTGLPSNLPVPNYCPDLSRNLYQGASGPDVQSLQRYLGWQGFLSSNSATGFFGPLTEKAVRDWQASRSIVSSGDVATTGWGVVGARTRAAILAHCKGANSSVLPVAPTASCPLAPRPATICTTGWQANTDTNGCTISYKCSIPLGGVTPTPTPTSGSSVFSVSPISGGSPLTVTFYTNIQSPTSYAGGVYQIDYGDSRVEGIAGCSLASVCSLDTGSRSHVYTSTGTYTARLIFINRAGCSVSSTTCNSAQEVIASIPITVGSGASNSSLSVSPVSGTAPLTAMFTTNLIETTGQSLRIEFGDGGSSNSLNVGTCVNSGTCTFSISRTYNTAGTYTAKLRKIPLYSSQCTGYDCDVVGVATVTVSPAAVNTVTLSASPTSGTAPLSVVFTVPSTPGQNKTLFFGDGTSDVTGCQTTAAWTTTHVYATSSTYYPYLATPCMTSGGTSLGGVTITVSPATSPNISVSTSPSSVARGTAPGIKGATTTISWNSTSAPSGAVVALWLVKNDGTNYGLVAANQPATGSYAWPIPGPKCDASGSCMVLIDSPAAYYTDLGSYSIVARLYTPSGAYLGGYPPQNPVYPTFSATATSTAFSITQ